MFIYIFDPRVKSEIDGYEMIVELNYEDDHTVGGFVRYVSSDATESLQTESLQTRQHNLSGDRFVVFPRKLLLGCTVEYYDTIDEALEHHGYFLL